ncbi:MAG: HNH endonuclease [Candidatus Roizmanbacteria bacterium]|nr:HNH endonuclease [Candidatus Roizmanbacteria bacterium]
MATKKKTKKKLPTIGKLKSTADRTVQDYFRRVKEKCELCFHAYQVVHHFIPKSLSNYLRYDPMNFIYICSKCHSKFHSFPDPMIGIRVERIRGDKWVEYIEKHRYLLKKDNRAELNGIIEKYRLSTV